MRLVERLPAKPSKLRRALLIYRDQLGSPLTSPDRVRISSHSLEVALWHSDSLDPLDRERQRTLAWFSPLNRHEQSKSLWG